MRNVDIKMGTPGNEGVPQTMACDITKDSFMTKGLISVIGK